VFPKNINAVEGESTTLTVQEEVLQLQRKKRLRRHSEGGALSDGNGGG
jgi:hypothetical protein